MYSKALGGNDALYSILQMPSGIPVATVAIDGAKNAAILAARILAVSDEKLLEKLKDYKENLKEQVVEKDAKLKKDGWREYLKSQK